MAKDHCANNQQKPNNRKNNNLEPVGLEKTFCSEKSSRCSFETKSLKKSEVSQKSEESETKNLYKSDTKKQTTHLHMQNRGLKDVVRTNRNVFVLCWLSKITIL